MASRYQAVCDDCGPIGLPADSVAWAESLAVKHRATHDAEALPPAMRFAARAASTRLAVEAAMARARMWLAHPASDPAPTAEHVLREVLALLEDAPTAVSIAQAPSGAAKAR